MSWVTILWSASCGACVMLALLHVLVWCRDRRSWANLCFTLTVLGVIGLAICEMITMSTDSPEVFGRAVRWAHVAHAIGTASSLGFMHFYFRMGSPRFLTLALSARFLVVVANFTTGANLHIRSIQSLQKITFLGEQVSILGDWTPNPWVLLGQFASLAYLVYIVDLFLRLRRTGQPESRKRALIICGPLALFIVLSALQAGLVAAGVLRTPFMVSFLFLGVLLAMSYELSNDLLRAALLARQLQASEQRLIQAATAARLAQWEWDILTDRIWVSPAGRMLYGIGPHEEVDLKRFLSTVKPADLPVLNSAMERALAGPGPFFAEYRRVLADGLEHWIEGRGGVERDGQGRAILLRGVSLDITERRHAEERFRLIFEAAPNALVMVDSRGRIVLINAQAEVVFGYPRAGLLGQGIERLIPERFGGHHPALRDGYLSQPVARPMGAGRELYGRRQDGTEVPVEIGLQPFHTSEGRFVLASIIDISQRKLAEQEADRNRRELEHLSRVNMLGELSSALAHELNQPLGAMLSNSQAGQRFLRQGPQDVERVMAIFNDITDDAKRARGVIQGLRAMLKKDVAGEAQAADVNEAVAKALLLLQGEISMLKAAVNLHLDETLPPAMAGRVQVQQVLINLILNSLDAMKFLPPSDRKVNITTERTNAGVALTVHDSGPGIAPEIIGRLFEPFVSSKHDGLGLGLVICRRIAARFGGELCAENHPMGGAMFRMTLPVAEGNQNDGRVTGAFLLQSM